MKTIKIRHFHRVPFLVNLIISIFLPVCLWFFIMGITKPIVELILIGGLCLIVLIVALISFLSYGIKITPKRVVLVNQHMLRFFCYEDVIYIKIDFYNNYIEGVVKAKYEKPYEFSFWGTDFSGHLSLFPGLWISELKLNKEFVDKSIESLSTCEKVRIRNFYTLPE
ncbi:MAG: hypothetical protein IJX13_08070 [Clostridia bacterium]|nr:hypothetical protein [Clostridia bacterium]